MTTEELTQATAVASDALVLLEALLRRLPDGDLHLADPEGGWTCAQITSHIHISGLLWIADLERLRQRQGDMFMFREELGHDAVGAIPPTAEEAANRIASLRTAIEQCLPAADSAVLDYEIDVPPFGPFRVGTGMSLIMAHLAAHADQIRAILEARGRLPTARGE
jgi:uncharacterized damage-inducible protein DinB